MDTDLHKLFIDQLQDIYDAEHRIAEAIPQKIDAAQSPDLKLSLEGHLQETKDHIARLERVFEELGETPERSTCQATKGLLTEANELLETFRGTKAIDAAIVCAGQKVEHYEIATYGCLFTWAKQMGHSHIAAILKDSLSEEKEADSKLTAEAKTESNLVAEAIR
ncbi:ferritin-like domain-containing protein [Pelagicoccus sp. SDUM812003]|uniref:YciE/YciF ferroxidase family protein n=1 Tax=Pelagicoccus sp. SDUM812003 TaxID=3041267 RepID=UPI00280D9D06|nr:ferritin-like domain-containing protein [Pelagicoccus sp. SDUM812003]MDQ8205043.1 ferritin-like domain-containing protein [Pelagicoccus sp. SDUM812003]